MVGLPPRPAEALAQCLRVAPLTLGRHWQIARDVFE